MSEQILQVDNLQVEFKTDAGIVEAVNDISFDLTEGETLGIVGESGSGKTVSNLAIMGLVPQPPGRVVGGTAFYRGEDLLHLGIKALSKIRGHRIAMIFQDPMTALNPFLTVEEQLTEVTQLHLGHSRDEAIKHAINMLKRVGIVDAEKRIFDYPHQFSGGMRQRVMIAMALSCNPDILIADEPTTALDVTIQAQILDLMKDLQRDEGTAIILITHDLGVVANICHRVLVMYGGKIVEKSRADTLFANPRHPYTLGLLESIPRWDTDKGDLLQVIPGQPPDMAELPDGCAYYDRCPFREDSCQAKVPSLVDRPDNGQFACFVNVDEATRKELA
jgi:oligopeptide/dipeptide ABC transporter ATP-binding protein